MDDSQVAAYVAKQSANDPYTKWWNSLKPEEQAFYKSKYGDNRQAIMNSQEYKQSQDPAYQKAQQQQASDEAESKDITAEIHKFYNLMSQPSVDAQGNYVDPIAKQLAAAGNRAGMQQASNGLGSQVGNLVNNAQVMQATVPYMQHKQDMAQQALGTMSQRNLNLNDQRLAMTKYQNDLATQKWAGQANQNAGVGSLIGGVAGAALGTFALPGLGTAAGAKLGSSLGEGLGTMTAGTPIYSNYYKPSGGGY